MIRFLVALVVVIAIALFASAIHTFRLHCEGFGCTGIGILWMSWTASLCINLLVTMVVRSRIPAPDRTLKRIVSAALFVQLALAVALGGYWLQHNSGGSA